MSSTPDERSEPGRRALFRFGLLYTSLFFLPPFGFLWEVLVPWVGAHVLGIEGEIPSAMTGSGDRLFDWVQLLCIAVLALVGTALWCIVSPRAGREDRLRAGMRVGMRYALAFSMLGYGFHKLLPLQFGTPGPWRLLQSYGDSSPMGLLWTFMGQSHAYVSFTGFVEVLGGALLLSRRTTTLGAMVVAGAMTQVAMLNFCYDVPVKIFSVHLLLLAVLLLVPDARRLFDFFVRGRATTPPVLRPPFATVRRRRLWLAAKALAVTAVVGVNGVGNLLFWLEQNDAAQAEPPAYEAVRFVREGIELPPLVTDPVRWRRLTMTARGNFLVTRMDGTLARYRMERADDSVTLTITPVEGEGGGTLVETVADDDHRALAGTFDGVTLVVELRRIDASEFLLRNRGFHWISEVPFNR